MFFALHSGRVYDPRGGAAGVGPLLYRHGVDGHRGWKQDASGGGYFKQAWTHVPSSESLEYRHHGWRAGAEVLSKYELAAARNEQAERNSLRESFFATGGGLLIPASRAVVLGAVHASGEPEFVGAPVQAAVGVRGGLGWRRAAR